MSRIECLSIYVRFGKYDGAYKVRFVYCGEIFLNLRECSNELSHRPIHEQRHCCKTCKALRNSCFLSNSTWGRRDPLQGAEVFLLSTLKDF